MMTREANDNHDSGGDDDDNNDGNDGDGDDGDDDGQEGLQGDVVDCRKKLMTLVSRKCPVKRTPIQHDSVGHN